MRAAEEEELGEVVGFVLVGLALEGDGEVCGGVSFRGMGEVAADFVDVEFVIGADRIEQVEEAAGDAALVAADGGELVVDAVGFAVPGELCEPRVKQGDVPGGRCFGGSIRGREAGRGAR